MGRRRRRVDQAAAAPTGVRARTLPEAIAALSRSLPAGPSPEIFRRAKFNRPEAAPELWRILFRVLEPLRADHATLSPGAQARWVKAVLLSYGYPRPALAQLPEDGSQGSRELLLALSWLLARGPVLEWLLAQTCVHVGDQVPTCECRGLAGPQGGAEGSVDLRHLQWLMGRLKFRWRHLICSQQEQCALLSKIHTYTCGCHSDQSLGHLSVTETKMLRDPEGSQQLLEALDRENARLEAALEWRRRELVFWQWMDTVLGACPPGGPTASTFLPGVPKHRRRELELVAQDLQALREELREQVLSRRQAWDSGAGALGRGPEWSAARQALRQAVEQELLALQRSWEQDGDLRPSRGPQRLVKIKPGAPGAQGLLAAEAISTLRSQQASLEAVLCGLQARCRQALAGLAGAVPGLVWILPPGR